MAAAKSARKTNSWQLRLGERRTLLVLGDLAMAVLALGMSLLYWGTNLRYIRFDITFLQTRVPVWFYLLPVIWLILLIDLYDVHQAGNWIKTIRGVAVAAIILLVLYLVLYVVYVEPPRSLLPRRGVASFLILVVLLTLAWRRVYINIFTAPQFMRRVLLVGGGYTGQILLQIVASLSPKPFKVIGIIDDDPGKQGIELEGCPVLGTSEHLLAIIGRESVSDLIVAISGEMNGRMFQALLDAQELGTEIIRMPVAYEEMLGRIPIRWLEADWILTSFVDRTRSSGFYELFKRTLDLIGGLIGVGFLVVLFPFIALIVLIDDGRPIFYYQTRSGRGGQAYRIYKFRTMCRDAEADGQVLGAREGDQRVTRSGLFMRKTHLDELPQFLNVLRGEMSMVGPRAERPELIEQYQQKVPFYRARLLVKPGITGWAQVNFGYAATVDETITKLEYDLFYIEHRSLLLDLVILLRTPSTMFGFRGR